MKHICFVLLACSGALATLLRAADPPAETALPAPPMQGKPWIPPKTNLPPLVVSAIKDLFDQGMPDPRGCEYREVEIADPYLPFLAYPGQTSAKVHAWVLPGRGATRFAVGWNGRVNTVLHVGARVDLRSDFPLEYPARPMSEGILGYAAGPGMADSMIGRGNSDGHSWVRNEGSLSETSILPIKVALLLRLGEARLAEGVWKQCAKKDADPYLDIAREWLLSWKTWGMGIRMKGDMARSLQTFRALVPLKESVAATAAKRKLPYPLSPSPEDAWSGGDFIEVTSKFYFEELEDLPALIADEERRIAEPPYIPVLESGQPAAGPARVAALIRDLETIKWFDGDPVIDALIREDSKAIDPLLQCLEEDMRLTLGGFPVYEEAYLALGGILTFSPSIPLAEGENPRHLTPAQRKALAAKFRDYRAAHNGPSAVERWFAMLQDDNATPDEWMRAADNLTQRGGAVAPPNMFARDVWGYASDSRPMDGEPLRSRSNPSVSDLLVKRYHDFYSHVATRNTTYTTGMNVMLGALAAWDGKARAADLREMTRLYIESETEEDGFSAGDVHAQLFSTRFDGGDSGALADYADWVTSLPPESVGEHSERSVADTFHLMWEHPADPAIVKAAEKIFGDKNSPWSATDLRYGFAGLLNTPMLGVPAFRDLVLKALADTSVVGYAVRGKNGKANIFLKTDRPEQPGKYMPPNMEIRMCDYYASILAGTNIFPECNLIWTVKQRDTAVAAASELLRRCGDDFRYGPQDTGRAWWNYSPSQPDTARVAFPPLDHPATPRDVAQGRAIFSLPAGARIAPMPAFPLYAERPSLKEDKTPWVEDLPHGKTKTGCTWSTSGKVWQVEEILVDGKWQRYYGFAGPHQLARVPAAEIEFPAGKSWTPLTPFIDARIEGPKARDEGEPYHTVYHFVDTEAPLVIAVKARNHHGLAGPVPAAFLLPANAGKSLPPGLSLTLSTSARIPPGDLIPFDFDYGEWRDIPLRKEIVSIAPAKTPAPLLEAATELTLLQIDLRDYFDITRPGSYRLQATFRAPGKPIIKSQEIIFSLVEKQTDIAPSRLFSFPNSVWERTGLGNSVSLARVRMSLVISLL